MDKNQLLRMAENPNFVSGIFNYCDRWCERCPLTTRCFLFATELERFPNPESKDLSNEEFWGRLHQSFELTMELIRDLSREQGIDLTTLDLGEEQWKTESSMKELEETSLARASKTYASLASAWLKDSLPLFQQKQKDMLQEVDLGIEGAEVAAHDLRDAVEIVQWYQYLIHAKLLRALTGESWSIKDECREDLDEYPSDSAGSAKVALIAMDRSLGAWGKLHSLSGEAHEGILDIMVHLGRLRTSVENHFANARSFVRPGFDQEV